jgi:hypothetical protein
MKVVALLVASAILFSSTSHDPYSQDVESIALSTVQGEGAKESFKSLQDILEAMPRQPEKEDNILACQMNSDWLSAHARNIVIGMTGCVDDISPRLPGESRVVHITLNTELKYKELVFEVNIFATSAIDANINEFAHIHEGDIVALEGEIIGMVPCWKDGRGTINVFMSIIKVLSIREAKKNNAALDQNESAFSNQHWEYEVLFLRGDESDKRKINKLASKGWEYVGTIQEKEVLLKRGLKRGG